jgi:Ras family protein
MHLKRNLGIVSFLFTVKLSFRQVQVEELQELARDWNCRYIESSAKHNENINTIFEMIISEIEKGNNSSAAETKKECVIL